MTAFLRPLLFVTALASAGMAQAQLGSVCTLNIQTTGALGANPLATELSSQLPGGRSAVVIPVILGLLPTIHFTAPTVTSTPSAYSGTPLVSMSYASLLGANQPYTNGPSSYKTLGLTDVITINMRLVDPNGFRAGEYRAATTMTCQLG